MNDTTADKDHLMTNAPQKFKSRPDDEFGVHVLEDIAQQIADGGEWAMRNFEVGSATSWFMERFEEIAAKLQTIDTLLALDTSRAKEMKESRGVAVCVMPELAKQVTWFTRAFRDPIRLAKLTEDASFSEAYLNVVNRCLDSIAQQLEITADSGGMADLACNKGLRRFFIKSLREISYDLDFELVYNVFANSNLSGDQSKPSWESLIDNGKKKPPTPPRGSGPNNGGNPKGALVPFPQQHTIAVAKAA